MDLSSFAFGRVHSQYQDTNIELSSPNYTAQSDGADASGSLRTILQIVIGAGYPDYGWPGSILMAQNQFKHSIKGLFCLL